MTIRTFQHGDQTFSYSDHTVVLPITTLARMHALLDMWVTVFPKENTYTYTHYNIPCLMARFDCVVREQGEVETYELQPGCGWAGFAGVANPSFRACREEFVHKKWPPFKLLLHETRTKHDDTLWLEQITLEEAMSGDDLLQIRFPWRLADDRVRATLISRSVSPWKFHAHKGYGTRLQWWERITWKQRDTLPWDTGFALKPLQGFGSSDVLVWNPKTRAGRATRTQIERVLETRPQMVLQRLIEPMPMEINGASYNGIYRAYFGFNTLTRRWEAMGGLWTARPHPAMRIHGASDAISGPLLVA